MAPRQDKAMVLRRVDSKKMVAAAVAAASAVGVQGVERKQPHKVPMVRSRPQLLELLAATQTVAARRIIIVAVDGVVEQESAVTKPTAQVAQQFLRQHLRLQCRCMCIARRIPAQALNRAAEREYAGVRCGLSEKTHSWGAACMWN